MKYCSRVNKRKNFDIIAYTRLKRTANGVNTLFRLQSMNRKKLKDLLFEKTGCGAQHDGRPCGTCFFNMSEELTNQDRQAVLLFRGDYGLEYLDNLPADIEKSIEKIVRIAENF